jgi:hypothetical protein
MAGSLNQMASGLLVCDFAGPVLLLRAKTLFAEATWGPMAVSDMPQRPRYPSRRKEILGQRTAHRPPARLIDLAS